MARSLSAGIRISPASMTPRRPPPESVNSARRMLAKLSEPRWQGGGEICALLNRGQQRRPNLLLEAGSERPWTAAPRLKSHPAWISADLSVEAHRLIVFNDWGERDRNYSVPTYQPLDDLLAEGFGASPFLIVHINGQEACRSCRYECGALERNALSAFVRFIHLGPQEIGDVVLESGEIGAEAQLE